MRAELKIIDSSNERACIALSVTEEQTTYIATNARSLEQARQNPKIARPFAVYIANELVGFTMFAFDPECEDPGGRYWLWRFMIHRDLQGRGYGSAALNAVIGYFREHGADSIRLSTKASNQKALSLYRRFGFRENGEMNDAEIVLELDL